MLAAAPAHAEELPGAWFLDVGGTGGGPARLAVGGSSETPPTAPGEVCLAWSWTQDAAVELYPSAEAGEFVAVGHAWTLRADGTTLSPEGCRPGRVPPFPELAIGPAGGLWFLNGSEARAPGAAADWAALVHTVEAAYRQSAAPGRSPLDEIRIGTFGGCRVVSHPADRATQLDRWLPLELPGHARAGKGDTFHVDPGGADAAGKSEQVEVRRFLWWVDSDAGGCLSGGAAATLDLFPWSGDDGVEEFLLSVEGVTGRTFGYTGLDPDDWSPRVRSAVAALSSGSAALRPTAAQLDRIAESRSIDLCEIDGAAELCRRNETARRQLFTAVALPGVESPWPRARIEAVRQACADVLREFGADSACSEGSSWRRTLAGELVAGFVGEAVISDSPRLTESWRDGKVIWKVDDPGRLAAVPELELRLLDGTRVTVNTEVFRGAARAPAELGTRLFPALSVLALALSVLALIRSGPRRAARRRDVVPSRKHIEHLIERAVDRRLDDVLAEASRGKEGAAAPGETTPRFDEPPREPAGPATEASTEPEDWDRAPARIGAPPPDEPRIPPSAGADSVLGAFRQDVESLDDSARRRLVQALDATVALGCWIELLWPVLQEAAGAPFDTIPGELPEAAAAEWRRARRTLEDFTARDVPAVRALLRALGDGHVALDSSQATYLESTGLLESETPLYDRLKQYLEPFDHPGRLGEITLALQYLVEAYPVEQLGQEHRKRLRRGLAEAIGSVRLEEDFHRLVARIAIGVGLVYRPVPYYKSRLDQSEFAFVRQQVSPISLSERVGFQAAATDPAMIVRLERPFFVSSAHHVYYAGHAHVARG